MIQAGYQVTLFDKMFNWHVEHLDVPKVQGDILDSPDLASVVANSDAVFHLAALSRVEDGERDSGGCFAVNFSGTLRVIQLSSMYDKMVFFASSREVYGNPQKLPVTEQDGKNPISNYGLSKLFSELLLSKFRKSDGLRFITLRFANVFGSSRDIPERVIPRFISRASNGLPLTVYGGEQVLDFTFIDTVVKNVASLLEVGLDHIGEDFNLASGEGVTIQRLAGIVRAMTGSRSEIIQMPSRKFDVDRFIGDPSKVRETLKGRYASISFRDALKIYIARCSKMG
jgi:nucleoside-diphosphate-sugar epimerase